METSYQLGPFRLDGEAQILFRGARPLALGERAVALLRVLVERAGAPVSKDALIEAAWPGVVVEESNLTVQVAALRRALGEEVGGERWIETLQRRGYRYIGPVSAAEGGSRVEPAATPASPAPALPERASVAVLPFANLSGDQDQEYFADGMVEAQLELHVQGAGREREGGRPRAGGTVSAGRKRAQSRDAGADCRAAGGG